MPAMNPEALSITPTTRKPRRSDTTQRRIRRPFSVPEVEALVRAVEKLGTGRLIFLTNQYKYGFITSKLHLRFSLKELVLLKQVARCQAQSLRQLQAPNLRRSEG